MALVFCDSVDHYNNADRYKKWTVYGIADITTVVQTTTPAAPGGGQALKLTLSDFDRGIIRSYTQAATVSHGAWVMMTNSPNTSHRFLRMMDNVSEQISVRGDSGASGKLQITRNGTVLGSSTLALSLNTWYHMELKATIDPAVGGAELRVNGVAWIGPLAGINTRATANSYSNGIAFTGQWDDQASRNTIYVKHVTVADSSGAVANSFLGPVRVQVLNPIAAGNYSQWTPNDGTNANSVGEQFFDGDNSFVMSATANQIDTFAFTDAGIPSGTIHGIQHVFGARQDAGSFHTVASLQRTSGVDYAGTAQSAPGTYTFLTEAISINPATSAGYTVSDIDNLEAGYKLVS